MKLFYSKGACSLAPIIVAEWQGIDLDIEAANIRVPDPEYLALNPLGAVPALILDDGRVFTQVDAILQYFARLKPESRLLGQDPEESLELEMWLSFLTGDFHPAFGGYFRPKRYTRDHSDASLAASREAWVRRIHRVTTVLEDHLGSSEHLVLGRRTIADAYAYAMVRWIRHMDGGLEPYPNLARLLSDLEEDRGVQRALERESA